MYIYFLPFTYSLRIAMVFSRVDNRSRRDVNGIPLFYIIPRARRAGIRFLRTRVCLHGRSGGNPLKYKWFLNASFTPLSAFVTRKITLFSFSMCQFCPYGSFSAEIFLSLVYIYYIATIIDINFIQKNMAVCFVWRRLQLCTAVWYARTRTCHILHC